MLRLSQRILIFIDPSSDPVACGWILRNYLAHLYHVHDIRRLRVVRYRTSIEDSLTSIVSIPPHEGHAYLPQNAQVPIAVGWEKDLREKLAPRMVDLGAMMDPRRCAMLLQLKADVDLTC